MASLIGWFSEALSLKRKTKRITRHRSLPARRTPLPHRIQVTRRAEKGLIGLVYSLLVVVVLLPSGASGPVLLPAVGTAAVVLLLNGLFARYLALFLREVAASFGRLLLFLTLSLFVLTMARVSIASESYPPLFVPLPFLAIVLSAVVNQRFAFEATAYVTALVGLALARRYEGGELLVHLLVPFTGALVAGLSARSIRRRSRLVRIGLVTGLAQVATFLGLVLALRGPGPYGDLRELAYGAGCAFFHGIATGIVVLGILPVLEYVFRVITDITLLELSDQYQQPVLKKLLLEAPGTHHHSMMVATLAEAAAERIGANGLLARVGAIYHDIGKLNKPEYFTENGEERARRLHDALTPAMSTLIICAHPKDGMELGRYYDLPPAILDFIEQHHGNTVVEYFYEKARRLQGEGSPRDASAFRYPGPRPRTKEVGIVMFADSVEAASRVLKDPQPSRIETLIHELGMKKLLDHQFDDCALTVRELSAIEDAFCQVLLGVLHKRPAYPTKDTSLAATSSGTHGDTRSGKTTTRDPRADEHKSEARDRDRPKLGEFFS